MSQVRSHTGSSRPSTHSLTGLAPPASTGLPRSTTRRHAPCTTPSPIGHRSSYTGAELGRKISARYAEAAGPWWIRCATPGQRSPCSPAPTRSTGPGRSASLNGRVVVAADQDQRGAARRGRCSGSPACGYDLSRGAFRPGLGARLAGPVTRSPRSVAGSAAAARMRAAATCKGGAERAPSCDRQRCWRCLGSQDDRFSTDTCRLVSFLARWHACRGNGRVNEPATYGC
jgi:hypothetical protein